MKIRRGDIKKKKKKLILIRNMILLDQRHSIKINSK